MKMLALAAAALIGASFASTSASAMPANPSVNSFAPEAQVLQVGEWKGKRSGKRKFGNTGENTVADAGRLVSLRA